MQAGGLSLEDSITNIRGSLVPPGYSPYPFRANTEESLLDKLRSIVATYTYRKRVQEFKEQGGDFSLDIKARVCLNFSQILGSIKRD